jgi:2-dehydro-3-deoxyphosphooctonate aldolase (KDO 8-P synthase)
MSSACTVGPVTIQRGNLRAPLAIIAGPCVLESLDLGLTIARTLRDACADLGLAYIFKASFDKANRTSIDSPRGPGLERGLDWLAHIGETLKVPLTTDIHDPDQAEPAARAVNLIQIPAFLARQTDLLVAAGQAAVRHKRAVNVKKGQFMSPQEMSGPVFKLGQTGCTNTMLTERGTFFGYGRLVNDFLGVAEMLELDVPGPKGEKWGGVPVCFDCTHSTQRPGAGTGGKVTGGNARLAPMLARAAVASGIDALFLETHPDPAAAMSDAATQIPLSEVTRVLREVAAVRKVIASIN